MKKRKQLQLTGYRTEKGEVHECSREDKQSELRGQINYPKGKLTPQYQRLTGYK